MHGFLPLRCYAADLPAAERDRVAAQTAAYVTTYLGRDEGRQDIKRWTGWVVNTIWSGVPAFVALGIRMAYVVSEN